MPNTPVLVEVDPSVVTRPALPRALLGQAVWACFQAYAWDETASKPHEAALSMEAELQAGVLGHYPGVGVITHDFHWKNLIGPVEGRTDPTPREEYFDTPRFLLYGPDEYGRHLEAYRERTGREVEGSIQVNVVSGTPEEAADWVEYMNAPAGHGPWADRRAALGRRDPYRIRWWELGNEPHFTAAEIGHLTAQEYLQRIQTFVPAMKQRDPSIEIFAYVNPFFIGDPVQIGRFYPDPPVVGDEAERTWSQYVIQEAGELLDGVYFHWYGAWSDNLNEAQELYTSMYTGLVPQLDRLASDIEHFAPSAEARHRLRANVHVPEWNVFGGWVQPVTSGTGLQGAVAASRTLHCLAQRPEVASAQHMMLCAPWPNPSMPPRGPTPPDLFDIRPGYASIHAREDGSGFLATALYEAELLWAWAWGSDVVASSARGAPRFPNGVPKLDATAMRREGGLGIVITNAEATAREVTVSLKGTALSGSARGQLLFGWHRFDRNSWESPDSVKLRPFDARVDDGRFRVTIPPQSLAAWIVE